MSEEIMDDNQINLVEEETTVEQPQPEEVVTPKENDSPEQYTEREKRYYARMKQAENIAKAAREELARTKKPVSEIDAILEVQEATKDLSAQEIVELRYRAKSLGKSLSDARKDENFALWQTAWKTKVERENVPLPSTTQGNVKGEKTYKEMDLAERTKYFEELGLIAHQTNPRPSRQ